MQKSNLNESFSFDDVLVECSSQMNQVALDDISPFDLTRMKGYQHEFLLGYSVEYYDKKLSETKTMIKEIVNFRVRRRILSDYSYDGVDYLNIKTTYSECNYSRILLPTYKFTYNYLHYSTSNFDLRIFILFFQNLFDHFKCHNSIYFTKNTIHHKYSLLITFYKTC